MNLRKLQLELMRAILRSSTLDYDDAYPIVNLITPQVSSNIIRKEQEIEERKRKQKK